MHCEVSITSTYDPFSEGHKIGIDDVSSSREEGMYAGRSFSVLEGVQAQKIACPLHETRITRTH